MYMDKIIKYALPVLIASGILHLYFFYTAFGISIFSFLEIGEVLTAFLSNFMQTLILIALAVINRVLIFGKKDNEWHNEIYDKLLNSNTLGKRIRIFIVEFWPLMICSIGVALAGLIIALIRHEDTNSLILSISVILLVWVATFYSWELPILYKKNNTSVETQTKKKFFYMILLFVLVIYIFTQFKISSIKHDKSTLGTEIYLDNNSVLESDSTSYFIGKTNNYIFIYHQDDNYTEVYPVNRVKKLVF